MTDYLVWMGALVLSVAYGLWWDWRRCRPAPVTRLEALRRIVNAGLED